MVSPNIRLLAEKDVVSCRDAAAYAAWAGKELPTEAEWEFAARGGLDGAEFAWGDELTPGERHMASTWQGGSPFQKTNLDGHERTSPVKAYPPNGYGLYDMIGNVWEWTSDWYVPKHPADAARPCCIRTIRAAAAKRRATTFASRRSRSRARFSRAARTCAPRTIAAATARPLATRARRHLHQPCRVPVRGAEQEHAVSTRRLDLSCG